jgi:DNA-binding response OmpR family regulator
MTLGLELDSRRRIVRRNGSSIRLGPTGFRILELLVRAPDGLEREAIFERAFVNHDEPPTDTCVSVHISTLRKRLRELGLQITSAKWSRPYQIEILP